MKNNLFTNFAKDKKKIALVDLDRLEYSYNDILKKNDYIISKIKKKSLIVHITSNTADSVFGFTTFLRSQFTVILLDESFTKSYIKDIILKFKPSYIFCPKNFFGENSKEFKKYLISLKNYELLKTKFRQHTSIKSINRILLTTSGTTQSPKFVRLSVSNLKSNSSSIRKYLDIKSNQTVITTMPMAYSYGISIINSHLESGARIILNKNTIFEKSFWKKIKKYNVNSLNGVPQFYELLKRINFDKLYIPSIKYITQAGGKLEYSILKYFSDFSKKKGIRFFLMYGQTEASPRMSYVVVNDKTKEGSIGKALKGSLFKLITKSGSIIKKNNEIGEITYFGKNVSLGYASKLSDLKKGDINKGVLKTGDLAYKDSNNYYYLVGRKNRISKLFGLRLNLDDIEKMLSKNGFKIKCVANDKFLCILAKNIKLKKKITSIIKKNYGINSNYIKVIKSYKLELKDKNFFKEII